MIGLNWCRVILAVASLLVSGLGLFAQETSAEATYAPGEEIIEEGLCEEFYEAGSQVAVNTKPDFIYKTLEWCKSHEVFTGLEAGISVGSMGLGLHVSTPVTRWVNLRAGIDWVPRFTVPLNFNLNTYANGMPTGNFNNVAQMLYDVTGIEMDETVRMYGKGTMTNFKLLVDVFPIPMNRHWHVTAGFYLGTAKIGRAYNSYNEKPTLVALNIYNRGYEYFTTLDNIYDVPLGGGNYMDPDLVEKLQDRFRKYGRMGIHIGDFKDGTPYIMDPAPDGSVTAKAVVNHFKPYLGAGYSTALDPSQRFTVGVDLGVLFWGGAPNVLNYDYNNDREINFTKELHNFRGKVRDYMKAIKSFPVYPVLEVRFAYIIK